MSVTRQDQPQINHAQSPPRPASTDGLANGQSLAPRSTTSAHVGGAEPPRREIPPAVPSPPRRAAALPLSPYKPHFTPTATKMEEREMLAASQWLYTKDEINNTPSILDGISVTEERVRRAKGVNFIIQAGILLRLPQLTLGTAAVFFHRFYMRCSMVTENSKAGIHHYVRSGLPISKASRARSKALTFLPEQNIAATALFLASKAEETCRKTKEIVIAVARVAQKNSTLIIDEQSKEFWRWKDSILAYEETMLELLTFDVVLESPYTHLYECLKALELDHNKPVRNVAWAFLNDSCMTVVCLRMRAQDIAVAAIYFSANFNDFQIPDDADDVPWWARIGGVPERIIEAVTIMGEFYAENPLKKTDNPYEQGPDGSVHDLDKTRLRNESRSPGIKPKAEPSGNENGGVMAMDVSSSNENGVNGIDDVGDAQSEITPDIVADVSGAGDDDAVLKAVANDPVTHQATIGNGVTNGTSLKHPLDTKAGFDEDSKRSDVKKRKIGEGGDESEEGEVEE